MLYQDRHDAGRVLAGWLQRYSGEPGAVVLALPRGGVPVGFEIAVALNVPLDVFIVRKLGVPGQEELAMGAIASGGTRVINEGVVRALSIAPETIEAVAQLESLELERREHLFKSGSHCKQLAGKVIILVDDGLATGATMRAALKAIRTHKPAQVIVAVPVGDSGTCAELQKEAEQVICAATPEPFYGVGRWYMDFTQTDDAEVKRLLSQSTTNSAKFISHQAALTTQILHKNDV